MYLLLSILIVVAAVLLTLLVLVQNSKGGGLAAGFSSSNQVLGVRKTTDFLEKATWGLTAFIIVLAIFAASSYPSKGKSAGSQSIIYDNYQNQAQEEPGFMAPAFGEFPEEDIQE